MQLIRLFALPLLVLVGLIITGILGFISGGAGWIALSLMCLWPLLWGVSAWVIRGFRESWQLVPKQKRAPAPRGAGTVGQTLS